MTYIRFTYIIILELRSSENKVRKTRKKRRRRQKKILIIGSLSLLLCLCVGYAAFQTNLTITARGNIKDRANLYVSTTGSDTSGNGTLHNPYQSIQKAYDMAKSKSTIYLMDNITQIDTITMDEEKDIWLTSYNESNTNSSIIRGPSLTTHIINVQQGILTLENITIDGNNVAAQDSMINVSTDVYMENETLITKANNINDWGGGFSVNGGTLTMNGGTISECNSNNTGGAAIFVFGDHQNGDNVTNNKQGTFILNNGNISNNIGGYIIWSAGIININGGYINNNTGLKWLITNNGTLNISNGEIVNNTVTTKIFSDGAILGNGHYINLIGTINMTGGIIANNTIENGPAIKVPSTSSFILDGEKIMNNTSNGMQNGGIIIGKEATYIYKSGVVCGNTPPNEYETSSTCPN